MLRTLNLCRLRRGHQMGSCASDVFRVLFCGEEFDWGYKFTKEALQDDTDIVVRFPGCHALTKHCMCPIILSKSLMWPLRRISFVSIGKVSCCPREDVGQHIGSTDLAVPLMARLDCQMLDRAPRLKAILQYGVGVEGIDIPAVRDAAVVPQIQRDADCTDSLCREQAAPL